VLLGAESPTTWMAILAFGLAVLALLSYRLGRARANGASDAQVQGYRWRLGGCITLVALVGIRLALRAY
jgi:hypothetical protein